MAPGRHNPIGFSSFSGSIAEGTFNNVAGNMTQIFNSNIIHANSTAEFPADYEGDHQAESSTAITEPDDSPEAYRQFQRTQQRIADWAEDTAHCAPQYRSPFTPRSDVQDNEFYNSRSRSVSSGSSPSSSSRHSHSHSSRGHGQRTQRSNTIVISPGDSISQVTSHHTHRKRSHSRASRSHGSCSHHCSGTTTYIVGTQPQYASMPGGASSVQYVQAPQATQYPYGQPQPQPVAYVVHPRDKMVHAVYAKPQPHATYLRSADSGHASSLSRIFGSRGEKSHYSLSSSRSRSSRR